MTRTTPILLLAFAAVGCVEEDASRAVPELLVPDEVQVVWDAQFDDAEGVGALLPVDLMVYDANSGEPMGTMDLTVESLADDAVLQLLPADDVDSVPSYCEGCYWDAGRDRYIAFDPTDADGIDVQTDEEGLARVYIWVDALPWAAEISVSAPQLDPIPQHVFEVLPEARR